MNIAVVWPHRSQIYPVSSYIGIDSHLLIHVLTGGYSALDKSYSINTARLVAPDSSSHIYINRNKF